MYTMRITQRVTGNIQKENNGNKDKGYPKGGTREYNNKTRGEQELSQRGTRSISIRNKNTPQGNKKAQYIRTLHHVNKLLANLPLAIRPCLATRCLHPQHKSQTDYVICFITLSYDTIHCCYSIRPLQRVLWVVYMYGRQSWMIPNMGII